MRFGTPPVTQARITTAGKTLQNAHIAAVACRDAGLPFYVACALLEKESGGRNVFGNDKGGALSGFPDTVNKDNYAVFRWLVIDKGQTSNGVGPCQITYRGFFTDMEKRGLKPYDAHDNMRYGFELLARYEREKGSWAAAGTAYNGAAAYGRDLEKKVAEWKQRLGIK